MEKIIQIKESEYNELYEKASYNQDEIERVALEMYTKKGICGVNLYLSINNEFNNRLRFNIDGYLTRDEKSDKLYELSKKDKNRILEFINEQTDTILDSKYGWTLRDFNTYHEKIEELKMKATSLMVGTCIGWATASILTLICLLK